MYPWKDTERQKLTHAYAYGGPELAIKTINSNFNMNIRDFVTVDFDSMAKIVDAVGGVDIEVTQGELESLNKCIDEYADAYDIEERTYVTSAGMQHLNGMQACGYAVCGMTITTEMTGAARIGSVVLWRKSSTRR